MAKPKTVRRNVILPLYIERVDNIPMLDGYTWKELAEGHYGGRSLPCPLCGDEQWTDERCDTDGTLYPTVERALHGMSRRSLIELIKVLATR